MFGLFSRKTSAPVTATVTTTGSLFQALTKPPPRALPSASVSAGLLMPRLPGARQGRPLLVGDRPRAPLLGIPEHEAELGLDHDPSGVVEDALAGGQARAAELADRALHGHRLEGRVDLALEADRAAPHHVLVAADAVILQERVPPLLEIGEHDGVVDVAEPVEVAPAHLHAVPGVAHAASSARPSARRSGAERRTSSSA